MILKGFEIENWGCIKKLSIAGLPSSGVIVLHGRNRTGKSSLVRALRSCLMDHKSTATANEVKRYFPRGTSFKPLVSVTFQAGGATYRIAKWFGTSKSELFSETSAGAWKAETSSAAEAHERTCALVKGNDSNKGLQQLLWLTQAEFALPNAKNFDATTQSQLRNLLGVLQTPLDDRFIERVKTRWNVWHSGQRKAKQPALKESCDLAQQLSRLEKLRAEWQEREEAFRTAEELLRQSADREIARADLRRQVEASSRDLERLQEERQRSQERIAAHRLAEAELGAKQAAHRAAIDLERQRNEAEQSFQLAERTIEPAIQSAERATEAVTAAEQERDKLQDLLAKHRDGLRELQSTASQISARREAIANEASLAAAREKHKHASELADEIARGEAYLSAQRAPGEEQLQTLRTNRLERQRLLAEQNAASIRLELRLEPKAAAAALAIDGQSPTLAAAATDESSFVVRRRATLQIPSWGQIEIRRGAGAGGLDEIESELSRIEKEFSEVVTAYGVSAAAADPLGELTERAFEHRRKQPEVAAQKKEFKKMAPQGVEALRLKVEELQARLSDSKSSLGGGEALPDGDDALAALSNRVREKIDGEEARIAGLEDEAKTHEAALKKLRAAEGRAKEELAERRVDAKTRGEHLAKFPGGEEMAKRVKDAERELQAAERKLAEAQLTADEKTIESRLETCRQTLTGLENQLRDVDQKYHVIKGRLEQSEGLHAQRASLAARVEELVQRTERQSLERKAVDRLYELFEECRDKQLGALLTPIHDRVLGWMRALDLGNYNAVKFSDSFLPQALVRSDGTGEFAIDEESTGAQEQFSMLVRLALGGLLTTAGEPEVAILDDPLTHCDVGRLNTMRGILRRAAEGDPDAAPPAAPLQIIVLTCHPEWFRDERATVIDLEDPAIMECFPD